MNSQFQKRQKKEFMRKRIDSKIIDLFKEKIQILLEMACEADE